MKYVKLFEAEDYVGTHSAPTKQDAPMYDLLSSETYADDIYSSQALKMYGLGNSYDSNSISIIQQAKGKPNYKVKIYRTIPSFNQDLEKKLKDILFVINYKVKFRFFPHNNKIVDEVEKKYESEKDYDKTRQLMFDDLVNQYDNLKLQLKNISKGLKINSGDWVSISKEYSIEHGKSNLGSKFKILSKTVPAKTLFTDGNSIHEWGYQP